jgi:hypothetical protein
MCGANSDQLASAAKRLLRRCAPRNDNQTLRPALRAKRSNLGTVRNLIRTRSSATGSRGGAAVPVYQVYWGAFGGAGSHLGEAPYQANLRWCGRDLGGNKQGENGSKAGFPRFPPSVESAQSGALSTFPQLRRGLTAGRKNLHLGGWAKTNCRSGPKTLAKRTSHDSSIEVSRQGEGHPR